MSTASTAPVSVFEHQRRKAEAECAFEKAFKAFADAVENAKHPVKSPEEWADFYSQNDEGYLSMLKEAENTTSLFRKAMSAAEVLKTFE